MRKIAFLFFVMLAAIDVRAQDITLKTATGDLYGSLVMPASGVGAVHAAGGKVPVVLIIAGSGPTDRNGNAIAVGLNTDIYKILSDSLSAHGIASLRYDKRGIGASAAAMKSEADLVFEDYIRDAEGWIKLLKADARFSSVVVLGHSEGSLVGMVAAGQAHANGYISAEGAGSRIDKVIEAQLTAQSTLLAEKATVLFDSLAKGYSVVDPGMPLTSLFRVSVQPYMKSWLKYDPAVEIGKLAVPVLIVQGNTDLQTTVGDAELLHKGKPNAGFLIVDQMNHIFRQAPLDRQQNFVTYTNKELPLKPEFVKAVITFTLSVH